MYWIGYWRNNRFTPIESYNDLEQAKKDMKIYERINRNKVVRFVIFQEKRREK